MQWMRLPHDRSVWQTLGQSMSRSGRISTNIMMMMHPPQERLVNKKVSEFGLLIQKLIQHELILRLKTNSNNKKFTFSRPLRSCQNVVVDASRGSIMNLYDNFIGKVGSWSVSFYFLQGYVPNLQLAMRVLVTGKLASIMRTIGHFEICYGVVG